jgi:tripartite-type tricarboxylate transporter receptor subunit TctC
MNLARRRFLHLAAGAAVLPAVSRIASAQAYPSRPVRWIIPFPPGGGADTVARIVGQWLSERLGQPVILEHRPGGGTNIGTQTVVNSPPDGYTLLFFGVSAAINANSTRPFLSTCSAISRRLPDLSIFGSRWSRTRRFQHKLLSS